MTEHHNTTSRYYPVTKKDHSRNVDLSHDFSERENEGMDTHTHTSRYVPAGKPGWIFQMLQAKKMKGEPDLKRNWLGMSIE
jgi:uncharacterized protein (DUF885 family)